VILEGVEAQLLGVVRGKQLLRVDFDRFGDELGGDLLEVVAVVIALVHLHVRLLKKCTSPSKFTGDSPYFRRLRVRKPSHSARLGIHSH